MLQNLRVQVEFPEKYFQVMFSSLNGTYHVVNTIHKGFTNLHGELKTVMLVVSAHCVDAKQIVVRSTRRSRPNVAGLDARTPNHQSTKSISDLNEIYLDRGHCA